MADDQLTILVTGGSRGIGRAVVERLVQSGHRVAFTYRTGQEQAEQLQAELGADVRGFAFDLADRAAPATLVESIEAEWGSIYGLVNNAGLRSDSLLAMTADDDWDRVLDANLSGAFRLTRAVLRSMIRARKGSIVNLASLSALHAVKGQASYAAAKAGLLAMSRVVAKEMGKKGIRVNSVIPGYVATDMTAELPEEAIRALRGNEALRGGVLAMDVANAVAFFISDQSSAITGQSLVVDAGTSA